MFSSISVISTSYRGIRLCYSLFHHLFLLVVEDLRRMMARGNELRLRALELVVVECLLSTFIMPMARGCFWPRRSIRLVLSGPLPLLSCLRGNIFKSKGPSDYVGNVMENQFSGRNSFWLFDMAGNDWGVCAHAPYLRVCVGLMLYVSMLLDACVCTKNFRFFLPVSFGNAFSMVKQIENVIW